MNGKISLLSGAALISVALWFHGCNGGGVAGPAPSDDSIGVRATYSSLATREAAHHQAALAAGDAGALRAETACYAADMDSLMGAMMDSCEAMGMSMGGMMRDHDMDRMRGTVRQMGVAIGGHRGQIDALATIDEMREECEEHHAQMDGMLDRMDDALPRRHGM